MSSTVSQDLAPVAAGGARRPGAARALRWSLRLLVAVTWASGAVFGLYILVFFGGTALHGQGARWNESLPGLHDAASAAATLAMGLHFAAGGLLLVLGPVQLIPRLRQALPALHRWLGRAYVACGGLAGAGGLVYIVAKGTIGGPTMSLGFGLYGALMLLCATLAYVHARARRLELHRVWAVRLFALTVGSWLYRMEYGFWFLVVGRIGHNAQFTGWFDAVMVFFFYLPNLLVAEVALRGSQGTGGNRWTAAAAGVTLAAAAFVILATYSFTSRFWWPGIVAGITGASL